MEKKKGTPSIFISYARKDKEICEKLRAKLLANDFNVITDDSSISYKGAIYDYLMDIKNDSSMYFIILISENYLKSEHCMFEFNEISRNYNYLNNCFPLIVKNTKIFSSEDRKNYLSYWDKEIFSCETRLSNDTIDSDESNKELYKINKFSNNKYRINKLLDVLTKMYTFELDRNYDEIINVVVNALETKAKIDNQKADTDDNI